MKYFRKNKVISTIEAINIAKNQDIIFISGIFDILHFGHINFFRSVKSIAGGNSKLLIATHTDNIVKEIKGETRPYMNITERVELLSELECVDYVVIWDGWENITEFVKDLKPRYFGITKKSYEHSEKGNWNAQSWEEIARDINAQIIEIEILPKYSSSKFSHLFD